MKTAWIIVLVALLVALGFSQLIAKDAGYVLVSYQMETLEMSLAVALLIVAALYFIAYFLLRLILQLLAPKGSVNKWLSQSRKDRGQRRTNAGLLAYLEGNWDKSQKELEKSAERSDEPMLNYLIAARASQAKGDRQKSQQFLRKAENSCDGIGGEISIAIGLTQAEIQLANGQLEEGLVTLNRLRKRSPKHPVVLQQLVKAYQGLQDWQHLQGLLDELRKLKIYSSDEYEKLAEQVYCSLLIQSAQQSNSHSHQPLTSTWKKFPRAIQKDTRVIATYTQALLSLGADVEAEKILQASLKRDWSNQLVALYGKTHGSDSSKQLLVAEGWLKSRPNNAELLLCLGRIALLNELWGKAREYFEASLKFEKKAETYAELGRLLAHLQEHKGSTEFYQKGLLLSTHGLPALPQPHKTGL